MELKIMIKKYSPLVLATLFGAGVIAMSGHSSSAASVPHVQQKATQQQAGNPLLQEVRSDGRRGWSRRGGKGGWDNNHHGGGWGYFAVPLIIGGALAAGAYGYHGGGGHVEYCLNRYKSYNPRNNTWVAYSGRVHQCRSPYRY
jgi:hypothetical protein